MPVLDSVLRERQLRRTQRLQELGIAQQHCEMSAQALATAQRQHEEACSVLWQLMTDQNLCVQRLTLARAQEESMQQALRGARRAHDESSERLADLQRTLARIEKDIEKLEERRVLLLALEAAARLKREWGELDDWVLGRQGGAR